MLSFLNDFSMSLKTHQSAEVKGQLGCTRRSRHREMKGGRKENVKATQGETSQSKGSRRWTKVAALVWRGKRRKLSLMCGLLQVLQPEWEADHVISHSGTISIFASTFLCWFSFNSGGLISESLILKLFNCNHFSFTFSPPPQPTLGQTHFFYQTFAEMRSSIISYSK